MPTRDELLGRIYQRGDSLKNRRRLLLAGGGGALAVLGLSLGLVLAGGDGNRTIDVATDDSFELPSSTTRRTPSTLDETPSTQDSVVDETTTTSTGVTSTTGSVTTITGPPPPAAVITIAPPYRAEAGLPTTLKITVTGTDRWLCGTHQEWTSNDQSGQWLSQIEPQGGHELHVEDYATFVVDSVRSDGQLTVHAMVDEAGDCASPVPYSASITFPVHPHGGVDAVPGAPVLGTTDEYGALEDALAAAEARWASDGYGNRYWIRSAISCFCFGPIEQITTYDIDAIGFRSPGSFETDIRPVTVQDLFAEIHEAIDENYDRTTVTFDVNTGVPVNVSFDPSQMMADEEMAYTVRWVGPLPG